MFKIRFIVVLAFFLASLVSPAMAQASQTTQGKTVTKHSVPTVFDDQVIQPWSPPLLLTEKEKVASWLKCELVGKLSFSKGMVVSSGAVKCNFPVGLWVTVVVIRKIAWPDIGIDRATARGYNVGSAEATAKFPCKKGWKYHTGVTSTYNLKRIYAPASNIWLKCPGY